MVPFLQLSIKHVFLWNRSRWCLTQFAVLHEVPYSKSGVTKSLWSFRLMTVCTWFAAFLFRRSRSAWVLFKRPPTWFFPSEVFGHMNAQVFNQLWVWNSTSQDFRATVFSSKCYFGSFLLLRLWDNHNVKSSNKQSEVFKSSRLSRNNVDQ